MIVSARWAGDRERSARTRLFVVAVVAAAAAMPPAAAAATRAIC